MDVVNGGEGALIRPHDTWVSPRAPSLLGEAGEISCGFSGEETLDGLGRGR